MLQRIINLAGGAAAVAAVAICSATAGAQTTVSLSGVSCDPSGVAYADLDVSGFHFHSPNYAYVYCNAGANAFVFGDGGGGFWKIGGGTFSISSIDIATLHNSTTASTPVIITGNLFGGGTVSQTFTVVPNGTTAFFSTFTFPSSFQNLTSLSISQNNPYEQVTNLQLDQPAATESTTPEPSSMALLGTGLFGLVPMARRKLKK